MRIINRKALKAFIGSRVKEGDAVEQVSDRAVRYFEAELMSLIEKVSDEAVKGKYFKLFPIDVKRGLDKWFNERITKEVKLAFT